MPNGRNGSTQRVALYVIGALIVAGIGAGVAHLSQKDIHQTRVAKRAHIIEVQEETIQPQLDMIERDVSDIKIDVAVIRQAIEDK